MSNEPWKDYQAPAQSGPWDEYAEPQTPTQATPAAPAIAKPASGLIRRVVGDTAVDAAKGIIGVGEAAVGLGNLVSGGHAGKALEAIGYDPKATKEILSEGYSHERVAANKAVEEAKGFVGTAKAMIQNPSTIAGMAAESAPLMFGGGAVAQGLGKLTKLGAVARGAIGEGAVGAGMAAEGIRQETEDGLLSAKQTGAAIGSGAGTALLGAAGGKIAQKLGIADVDVMLAGGGNAATAQPKNALRRFVEGMVAEGVLEEMPQSMQEQAWQNVALDKPLGEGVAEAGAMGMLAGAAMGGPVAAIAKPGNPVRDEQPGAEASAEDPFAGYTAPPVADPATTVAQPATLMDGSPVPDPSAGPLSKGVNVGVQTGAIPTTDPLDVTDLGGVQNDAPLFDGYARLGEIAAGMGLDPAAIVAAAQAEMEGQPIEDFGPNNDKILATWAQALGATHGPEQHQSDVAAGGLRGDAVPGAGDDANPAGSGAGQADGQPAAAGGGAAAGADEAAGAQAASVTPTPAQRANAARERAEDAPEYITRKVGRNEMAFASRDDAIKAVQRAGYDETLYTIEPANGGGLIASRRNPLDVEFEAATAPTGAAVGAESLPVAGGLNVRMGNQTFPITDLAEAQRGLDGYRQQAVKAGFGASDTPAVDVVNDAGEVVAHFSYNGKLWEGPRGQAKPKEIKIGEAASPSSGAAQTAAPESAPSPSAATTAPAAGQGLEAQGSEASSAPVAGEAAVSEQGGQQNVEGGSFTEQYDARVKASREAGNTHLDTLPRDVEGMRGKAITSVHDPKVKGVVRTVDNRGNVYIDWSDDYSAKKEMASEAVEGNRKVMRSSLGPNDLKDYVVAPDAPKRKSEMTSKELREAEARKPERVGTVGRGEDARVVTEEIFTPTPAETLGDQARNEVIKLKEQLKRARREGQEGKAQKIEAQIAQARSRAFDETPVAASPEPTGGFNVAIEDEIRPAGKKRERGYNTESSVEKALAERGLNPADYAIEPTEQGGFIGRRKGSEKVSPKASTTEPAVGQFDSLAEWASVVEDLTDGEVAAIAKRAGLGAKKAPIADLRALVAAQDHSLLYEEMADNGDLPDTYAPDGMPERYEDWDYTVANFPEPARSVNANKVAGDFISTEEAAARLAEWKAEAKRIGKAEDHSNDVIISLFDATGEISKPWREAGYDVLQYDIKLGDDLLMQFPMADLLEIQERGKRVVGVIAQPPCTCFTSSGARWWSTRHDVHDRAMVDKMFGPKASVYFSKPKEYTKALVSLVDLIVGETNPLFHAMENPVGRIGTEMGLPKPTLRFDPHVYGNPYTKGTQLWGNFNPDLPTANVEPTLGSLMHKLWSTAEKSGGTRSITPEGFAYAFFMANKDAANASQAAPAWEDANPEQRQQKLDAAMTKLAAEDKQDRKAAAPDRFAGNTIFTSDKVEAAMARMRAKLGTLNSGVDPEMFADGVMIAGGFIENGVRKFAEYSKAMVEAMGDAIKPYLLSFYEGVRYYPGVDRAGMDDAATAEREFNALLTPADTAVEAVGEAKPAPRTRAKPKVAGGEVKLKDDYGTDQITGYPQEGDRRETGSALKDQFLRDTRGYLKAVADELEEAGFTPALDRKGKPMKAVSVNEGGMAGSGDVYLHMLDPNGTGVYVHVSDTSLRGVVPTTSSGIAVMYRTTDGSHGKSGPNQWARTDLTAAELAATLQDLAASRPWKADESRGPTPAGAREQPRAESDERPAITPKPAHNQAQEAPNAARELDSAGEATPAGAPTDPVSDAAGARDAGTAPADGGEPDGRGNRRAGGRGAGPRAGVGNDAGEVPVPARGKRRKPEPVQEPSLFDSLVRATDDAGPADAGRARVAPPQLDFTIEADLALGEGGAKTKYQRNVAAIRLLNTLEQEGRFATAEEQRTLALYVGWGGLAQAFDPANKDWTREHAELKSLLTPEEYAAAEQSTQYAHYTSREIVTGMYGAMSRLGFTGGRVLEAGGGVGNFIGLMPEALRTAGRFTLVERERIAAGIAKHLYPRQNVQLADFTLFGKGEDGYFDAVIGNPPFSRTALTDQSGRKHLSGLRIHNYFIAKSIDLLREGGILANVVSNGFMDSRDDRARAYIAGKAKFLGAIRLPNNAFAKNAGTEVTTDIVFFQKLPEKEWGGRAAKQDAARWLDSVLVADPKGGEKIRTNAYFAANPQMMLGEWTKAGSMYGPDQPALIGRPGQNTGQLLERAIEQLPSGVWVPASVARSAAMQTDLTQALQDGVDVGEGGFYLRDGALWQRMPDRAGERVTRKLTAQTQWTEKTKLGEKGVDRLTKAAELRATLRALLAAEARDDAAMDALRATLNTQYDAFVKAHGLLNDSANLRALDDDPDGPLLAALENAYTPGMGAAAAKSAGTKPFKSTAKKAPIFQRRVIENRPPVTKADSPADALNVSMAERGRIDAAYIGELLGSDPEQVLADMASGDKPLLFKDPATNEYVLRDEYLSGNVRKKLAQAKAAGMLTNAMELEKVIPEDVGAGKISARIGSPWVPASVFQDFATFLLGEGTRANLQFVPLTSSFSGDIHGGSDLAERSTYGTKDYPASKLLMALLNNREVKVTYKDSDGRTHTDKEATEEAKLKANDIRDKFQDWLFSDPERAEGLVRAYNDANNNYVTRQYDGSWLHFPGKVPDAIIKFRKHQRDFVARVLQDRTALADHVVGAGKTFSAIAAAMELKRTGLANKPMIVVPNHLVKQWAADFYRLYPGANILTATKKDFERANRRKFLARIATGDWDAVIIAHSSFGFVKPTAEFETKFNEQQIRLILDTVKQVEDGDGDDSQKKRTVKQLQALQERLENRIKSLREKSIDDLLDFSQLGVDQLFIDEAHMFKNLMFSTKMQNIRGLGDSKGSQRAYDMLLKTREVMDRNGRDQGVVFLTGTPVSNSLAEMYHMMRYLMPTAMSEAGFDSFDAWANTYASIEDQLKPKTSGNGYKTVTSFGSFNNTFELLAMFDQVSDTVTMDDIKAAYREENGGKEFPLPVLKTGRRQPIAMEKSEAQDAYMEEIGKRAADLEQRRGPPKKGEDNHLTLMSDARKAAMDIRMVKPEITEREKGGRIDRASDEIVSRYHQYEAVRGTQLVFADLGTPLKHAKKALAEYEALRAEIAKGEDELVQARAALGDEDAIAIVQASDAAQEEMDAKGGDWLDGIKMALRGFSIYDDLRAALVEKGIPANQVAFIHDFNTDEQKAGLFRRVNAGEIRVVIGSTAKMGAGTNVQERLVALHHLDIPWRPSDVEQREGRIIRQGNLLAVEGSPIHVPGFEVEILAYVTKDTLDKNMWDIQEKKLRGINQLRTRQIEREIENSFDEMEMSASEMQAAATGNLDLLKEIQLRNDVQKLERKRRSFDAQKSDMVTRKRRAEDRLKTLPARIERSEALAGYTKAYTDALQAQMAAFKVTINGKVYTDAHEAGQVLREIVDAKETAEDGKERAAPISVVLNGTTYTARQKLADAFAEIRGDADAIRFEAGGKVLRRRSEAAKAVLSDLADAVADQKRVELGRVGPFIVSVEGQPKGKDVEVILTAPNGDEQGNTVMLPLEITETTLRPVAERVVGMAHTLVLQQPGVATYQRSELARAQKDLADVEKAGALGDWPEQEKLDAARAAHKEVLARLKKADEDAAKAADAPLESVEDAFYSALLDSVVNAKNAPKKGTAEQWRGWLDGAQRRGEFKQSERDWLGVDAWLNGQDKAVTREQLADFIRAHEVRVEEVVLGDASDVPLPAGWTVVMDHDDDHGFGGGSVVVLDEAGEARGGGDTRADAIRDAQDDDYASETDGVTKFASYQLPGGENYRELLLTLPASASPERIAERAERANEIRRLRDGGQISQVEAARRFQALDAEFGFDGDGRPTQRYESGHWGGHDNILAHVRFNERTDADGKRVLFIEEIQSDWHQAGRKRGYGGTRVQFVVEYNGKQDSLQPSREAAERYIARRPRPDGFTIREQEVADTINSVPDAPFKATDEWAMLAFKRMVRHAAENGFDRIAWTTGAQQAERYDLSKQLSRITVARRDDGMFVATGYDLAGKGVMATNGLTADQLAAHIGKDLAEKAIANLDKGGPQVTGFSGLDLKVGGEGMKGFYDKILPSAVNKWAKKFGGKVGRADVTPDASGEGASPSRPGVQHSLDLTPAMRDAALQGQPLFQQEATELTDADLTPAERAAFDRQRVDRESLSAKVSKEKGERDADGTGMRALIQRFLGNVITTHYLHGEAGLVDVVKPGYVQLLADQRKGRAANLKTSGLFIPASWSRSGKEEMVIFTDVVKSPMNALFTAAHEVAGHYGLRSLLGSKLNPALRQAGTNPTVKAVADSMYRRRAMHKAVEQGRKTEQEQRLLALEEALADLAAAQRTGNYDEIQRRHGVTVPPQMRSGLKGAIARFIAAVRNLLRAKDIRFSDAQVYQLLENAWQAAQVDGKAGSAESALESAELSDDDLADFLAEYGKPVASANDATGRWNDGEVIFAMHEMAEEAHRVRTLDELGTYTADQLIAVPASVYAQAVADMGVLESAEDTPVAAWATNGKPRVVFDAENGMGATPDGANIDYMGYTVMMRPSQFLALATPRTYKVADGLQDAIASGEPVAPAFLLVNFRGDVPTVKQHEGRSRMMAIQAIQGDEPVPVQVFPTGGDRARHITPDMREAFKALAISQRGEVMTNNHEALSPNEGSILESVEDVLGNAMGSVRGVKLPAGYMLADFFNGQQTKALHWWHTSVGTMYNLAQRSPLFKDVFDRVQNMVADVSHYANAAMDLAPEILPKFDSFRDARTKQPMSAADAKKVAAAVFDGTLKWTRSLDGALLPSGGVDKAGVVWTDEELAERFGMDERQRGLYRQVRRAIDKSLDDTATTQMLRFMGEDGLRVREEVLSAATARQAAEIIQRHIGDMLSNRFGLTADGRESSLEETLKRVMETAAQVDKLKNRGYAPLSRFGRYTVYKDGEEPIFLMFETEREANRAARRLRDQFGDDVQQGTMSQEQFKLFKGMTPETLELFGEMLGLDSTGNDQDDLIFQSFIKAAKSNRSALKRLIHREGVAGYSEDVPRVLAAFLYSNARLAATNLHAPDIQEAIKVIPKEQGDLKDAAIRLNEYIVNPDDAGAWLQSFNFAQFLGGSIASALVNMTQPLTMSFPWLSQYGGAWKAAKLLAEGSRLAVTRGSTGNPLLDADLKRADADGHTQPQEVHQLQAYADGRGVLRSGDGTKAGDAAAKAYNAKARIMLAWGLPFSLAEQFNRRATFIAAWNAARDQGMADPYGFAVQAVQATQGIYNKANKPQWSRNAIGGMAFTFKQYSINYVEMLHRMWKHGGKEGKQGVLMAAAVMFLLAGAGGLPGADDLDDLLDGLMQRLGYNFSSKQAREEFFASLLGEQGAKFMESGLSSIPGMPIDVSGRLGMGNLLPATGLFVRKEDHTRDVAEIVGPTGDFIKRSFEALEHLAEGDPGKSILSIAPRAVSNAWKGVEMANTGEYRDTRGRKVLDTTPGEAAAKLIGFQPASVAKVQQASGKAYELVSNYRQISARIADQWAKGLHNQDDGMVRDAQAELADWNRKNPDMPIRISRGAIQRRIFNLRLDRRQRLAKTTPKAVRSQVEAMLDDPRASRRDQRREEREREAEE